MKILDVIFEQTPTSASAQIPRVESWDDLKKSFKDNQWRNIILHFLKPELERAASIEDREYQIQRAFETIGPKSVQLNPADWYSNALTYNIRFPQNPANWQAIYDNLKPHANTEVKLKDAPLGTPNVTAKEETFEEISKWVPTRVTEFTKDADLTKYVQDWLNVMKTKKRSAEWVKAYDDVDPTSKTNQAKRVYKSEMLELLAQFKKDGKVSKKDVDIRLFSILKTMDAVINNYLKTKK